ncbi:MAG: NAD(P)-dependent alcohol dehydrogenase [Oligoflexia bacterium]|nr:NAD(P)-dependent alcohol dehydrogenase [Oligoflexia bacterium]
MKVKGIAAFSTTKPLGPFSFERRDPKEHDVVIEIKYCGICHSDIHNVRSEWFPGIYPMVPGHEIAGVVSAVGSKVKKFKVGDHAGVGCFVDSCRECDHCKEGLDQYCLEGNTLTYNAKDKEGNVTYGGYSNIIVVDENYTLKIPQSIPLDKAAPLLCAGITLYSPLMHWRVGPGKKVGIMGLGGLGHMGVKIARALGAEVFVLSHSDKKQEDALKMGAHHFIATKDESVFKQYAGKFDLIINTVSSHELNMSNYFNLLKLDGTLVSVGAPEKPLTIHPFPLIIMRRNYAGSVIGSIKETQEMLDFCAKHNITPEIELITPEQINVAYERVIQSDVRYRFVIDISKI